MEEGSGMRGRGQERWGEGGKRSAQGAARKAHTDASRRPRARAAGAQGGTRRGAQGESEGGRCKTQEHKAAQGAAHEPRGRTHGPPHQDTRAQGSTRRSAVARTARLTKAQEHKAGQGLARSHARPASPRARPRAQMGFSDHEKNRALLDRCGGDVNRVVDLVLSSQS